MGGRHALEADLDAHIQDDTNPHDVTAAQTGAAESGHNHDSSYLQPSDDSGNVLGGDAQHSLAVAIHSSAEATAWGSIAIGEDALSDSLGGTAVGPFARTDADRSVALGYASRIASGASRGIAIGIDSWVDGFRAIAVGDTAYAGGENSVAIGKDASANDDHLGVLGTSEAQNGTYNWKIPGNLEVEGQLKNPQLQPKGGVDTNGVVNGAFFESANVISESYAITEGTNAMTVGPVTIEDEAEIEVPAGSVWTII